MVTNHGTSIGAEPIGVTQLPIVIAEFFLNRHESFRAEIVERRGKTIVVIGRWKNLSVLPRRAGATIEFSAHRTAGIAKLLSDLQRRLGSNCRKTPRFRLARPPRHGAASPTHFRQDLSGGEGRRP
jgi:hypothetical protein